MRYLLLPWAFAAALCAQTPPPVDANALVRRSIQNGRQSWAQSLDYYCVKKDLTRQFESGGKLKSTDVDPYRVIPLGYHTSFEELIEHDNEPVPPDQAKQIRQKLEQRRSESAAEKQKRFQERLQDRSYMLEVPDAFNFTIVGEETLPTGPAWIVEGTPRKDFGPKSRYAHMFPHMRGRLWIDKKDEQWVKADATATDTVSFGLFLARLAKGSHILLEQVKLPDGDWVPKEIEARASARVFLFWVHNFREYITYSDYRKATAAELAESR